MSTLPDLVSVPLRLPTPVYDYHQYQGHSNDCGATSLAIAANALLGETRFDGDRVAQEMNEWKKSFPGLFLPRIRGWATFPWGIVQYLRMVHVRARWRPFGTVERLRRNLHAGRMTLVAIGEPLRWQDRHYAGWAHFKVLFGYNPQRGFLFVDPGYDPTNYAFGSLERQGLFWQAEGEFKRQWRNLLGIYIEVGG
jgi:hypothetical protein